VPESVNCLDRSGLGQRRRNRKIHQQRAQRTMPQLAVGRYLRLIVLQQARFSARRNAFELSDSPPGHLPILVTV